MQHHITYDSTFQQMPIMTDVRLQLGCDLQILNHIRQQFDYAEQSKRKIFFLRFDVRFPQNYQGESDNTRISKFMASFMKHLERDDMKPQYLLVREQSREKHQHYHGVLWLDGNRVQNIYGVLPIAERLWASALDIIDGRGLIDFCDRDRNGNPQINGIMLRYDDLGREQKKQRCFHWASYLAKVNQKSNIPSGQRGIFSSRIPS